MAKPKHGPALFDLLTDDEREPADVLKVPRWWGHEVAKPRQAMRGVSATKPGPAPVSTPSTHDAVEVAVELLDGHPAAATLEMEGDRIRLTFTSVTLAGAIFALLIALLGVFALGHWRGDKGGFARGFDSGRASYAADAVSEIEAARRQPPATEVIGGLLQEPRATTPPPPQAGAATPTRESSTAKPPGGVRWIPDHTYVVVQEFSAGHRNDAVKAKAFLAQRGIDAAVIELPSGGAQLITTTGFDRDDPAQRRLADELLKSVRAAGAAYVADGGGYKLEGYFKKLKGETW